MAPRLMAAAMILSLAAACARSEKDPSAALAAETARVQKLWTVRSPSIERKTSRRVAAVALAGLAAAAVFGLWHRPS